MYLAVYRWLSCGKLNAGPTKNPRFPLSDGPLELGTLQETQSDSLGRTLKNWRNEIIAWHRSHASNGPTEAVNNLVKRVKRAAFGFRTFRSFRVRALLYAGKPNWSLLETVMPR